MPRTVPDGRALAASALVLVALAAALLLPGGVLASRQDSRDSRQPATRAEAALETVAERSGFKATSTHQEVVALMDRLAERSPQARRLSMGKTGEGREIPVLVFANPPVATPAEARTAAEAGRPVVLLFGNIHAGEVDGKEALLMLARDLATTPDHPLLKDLVIAIAPIYNADGNERFGPIERQRPGQDGPAQGAGQRHNAQDLDLNRDFVKLEAPETRALVRFLREWDPAIVVDTHTTNGSLHRFLITYAGPKVPAGDAEVIKYGYEKLLPGLTEALRKRTGIDTFVYGNFAEEHTQWTTFPPEPRYGTNYIGLRNRLGILSESYSYASYEDRIRGSLEFCREILNWAQANKGEIADLLRAADARGRRGGEAAIALRTEPAPLEGKRTALGFVEERREGQRRPVAGAPREYEVDVLDRFVATHSVERPFAYLLPASEGDVAENLQRHGIEVEELREDIELDVTAYTIDEVRRAERAFQGHQLVTIEATPKAESRRVAAGSFVVRTAQPLGSLAAYLLEPEAEDGLATWNFFDGAIEQGQAFPAARLEKEIPLLTTTVAPLEEERAERRRITYDVIYGSAEGRRGGGGRFAAARGGRGRAGAAEGHERPDFDGSPIGGLRWLDGEHYLQSKAGGLHKVHAATGRSEPFLDTDAAAEALAKLESVGERAAGQIARGGRLRYSDDYTVALFEHEDDLYVYEPAKQQAARLTRTPEREEMYELSPDGRLVAFVRDNDLYVVDIATQTERPLTEGGTDTLRNGKNDWVYFEEVFDRNWKAYWWSPDSRHLAFLQSDASDVDTFTLVDELREPLAVETARYPKPGTPNPRVKLGVVPAAGGDVAWADLSSYGTEDLLITGVGWWPDSSVAWFWVQDRVQTWMDLCTVPPAGGTARKLLRDETEAWVEPNGDLNFLEDGSFLLLSDRDGWQHLYHYHADGKLDRQVTRGEWDVRGIERIVDDAGALFVRATKDSFTAENLYRVALDGSGLQRLTTEPGSHACAVNPAGTLFIDTWSNRATPTKVALRSGKDGAVVRTLDTNPVHDIERYTWGADEQFQIETRDGFQMEASWVKPPDFDPRRRYPVWITTYAGPYAPTVRDAWAGGRTWDQMLANEGIVVMRVDPRSASGKGPRSAWTAYRQLGVQEAADLEDAVRWLAKHEWVDSTRIGLSGHSYGGYITAYAMTHSTLFAAGIAGAPVTDWRDYDTIYTERFMGTPQDNPEGYDKGSVVKAAADLHGRLLLIHGAMDDNVHPQNTIRLAKALQDAGKPFELMIYPGFRHGIRGAHYNRLTYDFIRRTMGVESGSDSSTEESLGN